MYKRQSIHRGLVREVPKAGVSLGLLIVVIEYGPGHSDDLVLGQLRRNGACGLWWGVVEGGHEKLENQFSCLTVFEVVLGGGVGVGQVLDPGLAAPDHGPVLVHGRGEDVVVLRVDAVEQEVRVQLVAEFLVGVHLPAG